MLLGVCFCVIAADFTEVEVWPSYTLNSTLCYKNDVGCLRNANNCYSSFCRSVDVVSIYFQLVSLFAKNWCSVYQIMKYLTVKHGHKLSNLGWGTDFWRFCGFL
jgi:hypothetical protein